jgi:menaquinone-9 beta-reductase
MESMMPESVDSDSMSFESADQTPWDGIVIGAGPAGAMAARQLALAGRRVLLVDKKRFPRWKICGACLNGQALATLRSAGLGALVTQAGAIELDAFRVGFRGRTACLRMPQGVSLSRARFDAALVAAATAAGVQFLEDTHAIVGEVQGGVRRVRLLHLGPKTATELTARVVLVATGLGIPPGLTGSMVARSKIRLGSRIGAGCVIADAPRFYEERTIFMAVGREGYVGAVRVEDGSLNVAAAFATALVGRAGSPAAAAAAVVAEAGFPAIAGLENAHWRGTAGLTRQTRPLSEERVFLFGDAAGYVEPFTGEGIAWALTSGYAVAPLALEAMERWDPRLASSWSRVHRRLIGRRQIVCRAVALGLRQPWLAAIGFEVLSRLPAAAGVVVRRLNAPVSFTNPSGPCPS